MDFDYTKIMDQATDIVLNYGPKLVSAILVWFIGSWVIKMLINAVNRVMAKQKMDESLTHFFNSLLKIGLKVLLIVSVLGMLGVEMTSFIAILGAAGLAVGMALSGTLQNFAGGVVILLLKPYRIGDFIDAASYSGTVKQIQLFNTVLTTPDNKTVIIPNGSISSSSLVNYSAQETRRVDWTVGVGYGSNVDQVEAILEKLCEDDTRILKDPAPFIAVSELGDSSVNFVVRAWVNPADYWGVFFDMNKSVYNALNANNINIPYPQMDVHVIKE